MRQRFMFWLDHEKPQEKEIAKNIQLLKNAGLFAQTIRDGIRLIMDLRQGKTEVLRELFPWVFEHEQTYTVEADTGVSQQLQRLEQLLLQQGNIPIQRVSMASLLTEEDLIGELEIQDAGKDEDNNSTYNFMISMTLQSKGNVDGLPKAVVEYGLRTGRIQQDMVQKMVVKHKSKEPKAMDVPQFNTPDIDIDDIDF